MEDDAEDIVRAVVSAAKAGDLTAMRLCIERLAPVRKGRPILTRRSPSHAITLCPCRDEDGKPEYACIESAGQLLKTAEIAVPGPIKEAKLLHDVAGLFCAAMVWRLRTHLETGQEKRKPRRPRDKRRRNAASFILRKPQPQSFDIFQPDDVRSD